MPVLKVAHCSYSKKFKYPIHEMFTMTNLDKQCLRIWKSEAKQSHWQEDGNAVRWTLVEDCAGKKNKKKKLQISHLPKIWHLHLPIKTHLQKEIIVIIKKKHFRKLWILKTIVNMCKEQGLKPVWGKKKSHQIWRRIENWTYNHKSIMHTKAGYNVWQHNTIHCTRGSLSDNEIQNSG